MSATPDTREQRMWRPASFAFFRDEAHALDMAADMAARGYRVSVCHDLLDEPVVLGELEARRS